MKLQKGLNHQRTGKQERERRVLIALLEHYLMTGEPVGSNTLKEAEFEDLSSATIRNYFANLENDGYLKQLHTSGGRIPTEKAFRLYANEYSESNAIGPAEEKVLKAFSENETKEIAFYLQQAAEKLSEMAHLAVFLSAPRFDHDFIVELKLVPIDVHRFLCVIITDFGVIQTELMHNDQKLNTFSLKRMETYFKWRLTSHEMPENLTEEEEQLARKIYNELMVRYIVGYSNFIEEEVYRTGFSKLLTYPDFHDTLVLANSLALFENAHSMRLLLRDTMAHQSAKFWIGSDLDPFATGKQNCSVIAVPYRIGNQIVGAIGLLGPVRLPYKRLFGLLKAFSDSVSAALTRNIYKYKIQFRQPDARTPYLQKEEHKLIGQSRLMLLENKTKE